MSILIAIAIGYGLFVLRDFHKLVREGRQALARDQQILDQITVHEPDDEDHGGPEFSIDMSWDEQTAVLEFIEQFRAIKTHYERRQQ